MKKLVPVVGIGLLLGGILLVNQPTAEAQKVGNFSVVCGFVHTLDDDPLVFPAQPGASHTHDFVGNRTTDAFSTPDTLAGQPTTCSTPDDPSAYWFPALYANGVKKKPTSAVFYYSSHPNQEVAADVVPFPQGMGIIGGNSRALEPPSQQYVFWQCGNGGQSYNHPPDCRTIELDVRFPFCWNGTGLTPADVVYPALTAHGCPPEYPVQLPRLRLRNTYQVGVGATVTFAGLDPTTGEHITTAPYYTAHADFINVWNQDRLSALVSNCINVQLECGRIKT